MSTVIMNLDFWAAMSENVFLVVLYKEGCVGLWWQKAKNPEIW